MAGIEGFQQQVKQDKWFRNLEDDMKLIIPYIEDKRVTDIAIGIGGELIVEGMGMGKQFTGIYFDDATTTRIIYASAAVLGVTIDPDNPIVEGVLPNWKIRIEGILPPRATENPMFLIRRPPATVFKMESYVEGGRMTQEQYDLLVKHIQKRSNIIIGGETGSGKTTLLNAIIDKMREITPDDRFYIVEDAGEIQRDERGHERVFGGQGRLALYGEEGLKLMKQGVVVLHRLLDCVLIRLVVRIKIEAVAVLCLLRKVQDRPRGDLQDAVLIQFHRLCLLSKISLVFK